MPPNYEAEKQREKRQVREFSLPLALTVSPQMPPNEMPLNYKAKKQRERSGR
jgi:hypothetical protein